MHSWPGALLPEPERMVSVSRSELYSPPNHGPPPLRADEYPPPLKPKPAVSVPPASVKFKGRDVTLWHYSHLEQVDMSRLPQRAALLRDAFQRDSLPDEHALRSGDRPRLIAWILDAQLAFARLAGLDASREWSVTRSFGAPAELGASRDEPTEVSPSDLAEQHNALIPFDMSWTKNWRPPSTAGGSSRGSSRGSTRSDATSVDPRNFHLQVAPPKQLLQSPAGVLEETEDHAEVDSPPTAVAPYADYEFGQETSAQESKHVKIPGRSSSSVNV